jgi:amino acid adenylation domain-containing protein
MLFSTFAEQEGCVSMNDSLVAILRWRAEHQPERHGFSFLGDGEAEELRLSYAQLDRQARMIAAWLQQTAAIGDRAMLLYPPGADYLAAFFGCLYAGVIAIPAYPPRLGQIQRSLPRLQSIARDARPQIALSNSAILSAIAPLSASDPQFASLQWIATDTLGDELADEWTIPVISGETIALLQYTSGSTAAPKGVILQHRHLLDNSAHIQRCFDHSAESCGVIWLPPYHDMGLIGGIIQPLYVGFPVILMPPVAFLQRPLRWLQAVSRYGATTSGGPNFAYELCVRKITPEQREQLDLSRWRVAFTGAEPVRADTLDRFTAAFEGSGFRRTAFYPCYGLAEATLIVSGGAVDRAPVLQQFNSAELQHNRAVVAAESEPQQPLVGCGGTLPGQQIVIAQPETLITCAPGEIGEILVAGASVAAGYWNREDETAQSFGAFLADSGAGPFLRTGDLGFLHDGQLFITGRRKDLIIIRGRNHYPQDIELTVERSHAALRPGCGAAFTVEVAGEERLVVVQEVERQQRMSIDTERVAGTIRQAVAAEHDVQVYAVVLVRPGSVPKTSSGKIQRQLCRGRLLANELEVIGDSFLSDGQAEAPTDELSADELRALPPEQQRQSLPAYLMAQITRVVGVAPSRLDPQQSISALGIDSLAAVEIQYRLESDLGIAVPMVTFLKDLSLAALADEIAGLLAEAPTMPRTTAPAEQTADRRAPLSYGQRAMWFLQQLAPESGTYNIATAVRIGPELDLALLRRAFQQLVDRHPALRTNFGSVNGEPFQQIHQQMTVSFEVVDAAAWSDAELEQRLVTAAYAPFDLASEPLLRIRLYRQADGGYVLLLAIHHIISDFWSLGVLARELDLLYRAEQQIQPALLAPLPIDYREYVRRQSALLSSVAAEPLWRYWQHQLAGATPVLNLPTDFPRPAVQSYHGATHSFALSPALSSQIKALAQAAGTTLYTTLLAAFQVLLHRYSGQDDLLLGSPSAGRDAADVAGLIGYFVNPVVLRARLGHNPSFMAFLSETRQSVLEALEHQAYPFPLLVERLDLPRFSDRSPLFQVMFLVQKAASFGDVGLTKLALSVPGAAIQIGGQHVELVPLEQRIARFDLTLTMADVGTELVGAFEYNRDLFQPATITRMADHFQILLDRIVADPEQRIAELPLLTAAEQQLLRDWNQTTLAYGRDVTIQQLIEQQAARTPHAAAIVFGGEQLTYAELNARANQLAHHLISQGVGPDVLVALCVERSLEMLVGMLAILKAGAAYVPLDPAYPADRLRYMLAHSQARVILTQERLVASLPKHKAQVFRLDADWPTLAQQPTTNPPHTALPENLAYIIFTSGSTGRPKGVAIAHGSVAALIAWAQTVFTPADLAGVLAATSICFDLSVFEIFLPLAVGGTVILAENVLHLPQPRAHPVTLINTVPSAMTELLRLGGVPGTVRTVNLAGEPLPAALVTQIYAQTAAAQVFNLYGPSEDTTYSTWAAIGRDSQPPVPIGRPIANTQAYLLNQQGQPVPLGAVGELYLGGDGLARGYLRQPDLTAERFLPDPFGGQIGARLYKTGDLARFRPDGTIDYLGRSDQQIKLRGFRIETGEIETVLARHSAVAECVVAVREDAPGDPRLVAYLVANKEQQNGEQRDGERRTENGERRTENGEQRHGVPFGPGTRNGEPGTEASRSPAESEANLRAFLKEHLPEYMIPSAFVLLDALPKTPNGKLDRKALPAPEQSQIDTAYVAPRTPTEEIIAGIWAELLHRERVGIHDNFFALGGHSLLAVQVLSRLHDTFQIDIPLHTLFNTSTVAALSSVVEDIVLEMIEGLTDDEVLQLSQSQSLGEEDRL